MTTIDFPKMCEVIARGWTAVGYKGREWTGREVFESDPRGELGWIPDQYRKSLAYLGEEE